MTVWRVMGVVALLHGLAASASAQLDGMDAIAEDCIIEPMTTAQIGSADEGILREVLVERGDTVTAGQPLARLESRLEQLNAELTRLQAEQDVDVRARRARHDYQRKEAQRAETLNQRKIISNKSRDKAAVEAELARLDVETVEFQRQVSRVQHDLAKARLDQRTIRSPIDGIVTTVNMSAGEFIHNQSPLLTVARIDKLNVMVFLPVARYGEIENGQTAIVEPADPIGGFYSATVIVVDRVHDAASATFGVRLRLPNPGGSLPAGVKCRLKFLDSGGTTE